MLTFYARSMHWGRSGNLRAWLLAAFFFLCAVPAGAAEDRTPATCHAYSDEPMTVSAALRTIEWSCTNSGWQDGRAVTWLRFDHWDQANPPLVFTSRITVFDSAIVSAVRKDGSVESRHFTPDDARPVKAGPIFTLPLPPVTPDTVAFVVAIERAHSVTVGSEAALFSDPELATGSLTAMLLLAIVTGMLVMPLLFDSLFFLVLRERFVLLHAAMTIAMIGYILTSGGVITAFVSLPITFLAVAGPLAWAFGVGIGGLFMAAFLEPTALPRGMRRALAAAAIWSILVPGLAALQLGVTQSFDNQLYFYAFLPVIPFYFLSLLYAAARGSRAARFLVVAWLPVILASAERLLRGIGVYAASDSIDRALFVALALEVIIVALGVADRFIAIRRERDLALTEARNLERLTERDPLTGLLNRRAMEERFDRLRRDGFTTLAVLDLDHFKTINDLHGHTTGDAVLKAVAQVLDRSEDRDTLAFRLGGEEFLLMLRGRNCLARAEKLREAIGTGTAALKPVKAHVTASMGVVEAPLDTLPRFDFEMLYARADRLLYEAKAAGRNRTMSESVKVFRPRQADRRAA